MGGIISQIVVGVDACTQPMQFSMNGCQIYLDEFMIKRLYCAFSYECNNNCVHCAVDAENEQKTSLSLTEIIRFLDRLKYMKDFEVELSGGEPTCRPELFYFLERLCTSYPGIRKIVLSNGRNFSKMSLAAKFSELDVDNILIPIHADTPQLHDAISQVRGSFDETMLGINNLYDYGLPVGLKTVINGLNIQHMPQLVELLARKFPKSPGISINGLEMKGKALTNKNMVGVRLKDAAPYIEKAIDAANDLGFKIVTFSIPPCVFSEGYRKYAGVKRRSSVLSKTPKVDLRSVDLTYGTVEKCRTCRYYPHCTGTWYSYLDVYGTEEISPIL